MNTTKSKSDVIDELALAEASAWLARQDSAHVGDEAAFKEWLAASPAHRRAFERVNDVWELIPGAVVPDHRPKAERQRHASRRPRLLVSACAALLLLAMGFAWMLLPVDHVHQRVYATAIGVQKTVVLPDNTRVTLNTDTQIVVDYYRDERHVWLKRGEALFHVKNNAARPFILRTGDSQIVDLGTVFNVRHYTHRVVVTLLEGKVWVGARSASPGGEPYQTVLAPGERLAISADGTQVLDRPDIKNITAWKRGQVDFNDNTLAQAVAEINRYNSIHIRIADPALASLRVSGVFSAQDPVQFASAVASLHDLHVAQEGKGIVLKR